MYSGTVKSFVWGKGWGFINYNGQDLFFHVNDFKRGLPTPDSMVTFEMGESPTKPGNKIAVNIQGTDTPGSVQGIVKGFSSQTGYGFIQVGGQDVFVHLKDVKVGGLKSGDVVWLDLEPSEKDPSKQVAKNVTGGSGHTDQGGRSDFAKGDWGKGGGKMDMSHAMGQMMAAAMMVGMMSGGPYGKSGGGKGGKGKGKGYGKW
eukprot:TRINITY_DN4450_c0_g3_i1.p1 TRINITY_DN4450_c0_g3~~TRINITY_DN4450_c0_g3_i1.p1  ORF type:complete len:202 (+),score=42.56 TRINITY_DN4450_c0_g3_i1:62-667(+)